MFALSEKVDGTTIRLQLPLAADAAALTSTGESQTPQEETTRAAYGAGVRRPTKDTSPACDKCIYSADHGRATNEERSTGDNNGHRCNGKGSDNDTKHNIITADNFSLATSWETPEYSHDDHFSALVQHINGIALGDPGPDQTHYGCEPGVLRPGNWNLAAFHGTGFFGWLPVPQRQSYVLVPASHKRTMLTMTRPRCPRSPDANARGTRGIIQAAVDRCLRGRRPPPCGAGSSKLTTLD